MNSTSMGRGPLQSTYIYGMEKFSMSPRELVGKYLEEVQVVVQFAFLRSPIEAHAASVQQDTDESDPKEIIGHVNLAGLSREGATLSCRPKYKSSPVEQD